MSGRLPPGPTERIDRQRSVSFSFDGKRVTGYEGDTIGSALHASGRQVISRSFSTRPAASAAPGSARPVEVDGSPACPHGAVRGMKAKT
jgi:sarcosine oxidase subunit alpha